MSRFEGLPNQSCRGRFNASSSIAPITPQTPEHNKRFEQSPDSNVSAQWNPGFYVYVWPLRAPRPPGTNLLNPIVMQTQG